MLKAHLGNMSKQDKALFIFLTVAIAATLGWIAYIAATPSKSERFTEFYILDTEGKSLDYPMEAWVGKPFNIVMGVVNHEYKTATYVVKIKINGIQSEEVNIGTLAHGEKWERKISITPKLPGDNQVVNFYLYKNGDQEPYLKEPLRLYIDVIFQY